MRWAVLSAIMSVINTNLTSASHLVLPCEICSRTLSWWSSRLLRRCRAGSVLMQGVFDNFVVSDACLLMLQQVGKGVMTPPAPLRHGHGKREIGLQNRISIDQCIYLLKDRATYLDTRLARLSIRAISCRASIQASCLPRQEMTCGDLR